MRKAVNFANLSKEERNRLKKLLRDQKEALQKRIDETDKDLSALIKLEKTQKAKKAKKVRKAKKTKKSET
jgi:succinate dehydrogenase flavin-adding protein (antitoxin of CptAB toxin-antitoxin module)